MTDLLHCSHPHSSWKPSFPPTFLEFPLPAVRLKIHLLPALDQTSLPPMTKIQMHLSGVMVLIGKRLLTIQHFRFLCLNISRSRTRHRSSFLYLPRKRPDTHLLTEHPKLPLNKTETSPPQNYRIQLKFPHSYAYPLYLTSTTKTEQLCLKSNTKLTK